MKRLDDFIDNRCNKQKATSMPSVISTIGFVNPLSL